MTSSKREVAAIIAASTLVISTVLVAVSWLANIVAPLDVTNIFLPLLIAVGFSTAIILTILRRFMVLIIAWAAVAVARTGLFLIALPSIGEAHLPFKQQLRVVQLNAFKENNTPDAVVNWVSSERPDVIAMEEVLGTKNPILRGLRKEYPYQISCLPHMRCSTVILSRNRPLKTGGLAYGDPENQQALSAVWATFAHGARSYTLIAVHMVHPWPWGQQESGRRTLVRFLETMDRRNVIIAGDFNLPPWTAAMARQDRLFGIPRYTNLPSWPAMVEGVPFIPILPIDHVYVGSRWHVTSIARGPRIGSDHLPLLLSLEEADLPMHTSTIKR